LENANDTKHRQEAGGLGKLGKEALAYARARWSVFPVYEPNGETSCSCGNPDCENIGKHPRTSHGLNDATTSERTITTWWTRWPQANIGTSTGITVVVDVDGHEGELSLAALEAQHGNLPETLTARTGAGRHLYFGANGALIKNSTAKLGPKLDVRGSGGYVILPPSLHRNGKSYEWVVRKECAALPGWLLTLLEEPTEPNPAQTGNPQKIPKGHRHAHLLTLAGVLRARGYDEATITAALLAENAARCDPPKPENEVRNLAHDVCERYPAGAKTQSTAGANGCSAGDPAAGGDQEQDWPDPLPLGGELPPVATLDLAMLPPSLRDWVSDVAERMQVPLDYPAASAVVALAGAVSRRVMVQPKTLDSGWIVVPNLCSGWIVVPNLWGAIIGPPGVMKSPVVSAMVRPLEQIEKEWRENYESELDAYEAEVEKYELDLAVWKEAYKRAARKDKKSGEMPERPEPHAVEPRARRLVLNDATFESMHNIMAVNPLGVLQNRDELTGWLASLDREGRQGERAFSLESWNGDKPFTMDRIGRGSIHVPACCLTLFGGIQPARLRTYLVDALRDGPSNDGLIQRFSVIVWPDIPKTWKLVDRPPNALAQARAARIYERLANLENDPAPILKFAPDAQEMFNDWWTKLETELRSGELHPAMAAHVAKYKKLVPALALIYELADWVSSGQGCCLRTYRSTMPSRGQRLPVIFSGRTQRGCTPASQRRR
jgi:putative DNA primase/helicase